MQRISVVGNSGSGKTTVAKAIAAELGLLYLELDGVFRQPEWRPLDTEEFRRVVSEFTAAERWVVDGGYSAVSDIVWGRAGTVIWVDPPRHRLMRQLVPRTLHRMATGTELWNGNRERWRNCSGARSRYSCLRGRTTAGSGPGTSRRKPTRRTRT